MDTSVIAARLQKLNHYVEGLRNLNDLELSEYLGDERTQAYVERRLQLAIQVCMDIAGYLIGQLALAAPDLSDNVFHQLAHGQVITDDLARRMSGMVRFRNILVQDYLEIDSALVYHHLTEELGDFDEFARQIVKRFL